MKHVLQFVLVMLSVDFVFAAEPVHVTRDQAGLYAAPEVSQIKQGRVLQTDGRTQNGFLHLTTKSGRDLWVAISDVDFKEASDSDLQNQASSRAGVFESLRFTYDLGGGSGSSNGINYTEINLGLNTYFLDWLLWRNALFYRFQTGVGNAMGLDTSVRGILGFGGRSAGLTLFAGPGFRFITVGQNAPFVEAGVVAKFAGLAIGIGAKTLYNSAVDAQTPNDNQVFLILSGGGSL